MRVCVWMGYRNQQAGLSDSTVTDSNELDANVSIFYMESWPKGEEEDGGKRERARSNLQNREDEVRTEHITNKR